MTAAAPTIAAHGSRLHITRLGLWLFFLSESCLFGVFAMARFYVNGTHTPEELNQLLGLGLTSILLLSSLTAYRAETAIAHGRNEHGKLMLLATMALGLIFLAGVVVEWSIAEFSPSDGYGTSFFSMTGLHASHVATGILFLGLAYRFASRGKYSPEGHWGATSVVMYWHFVDVVWVFFYPVLYLVS
jgi:cytochrome c oxidase subunit 3